MTTFDRNSFLNSLQNPSTPYQFIINLQTLIHNGEYSYSDSLSLFKKLFPNIKSARGLRYTIIKKYKDEELANKVYELVSSCKKTDCYFLQQIDIITFEHIK